MDLSKERVAGLIRCYEFATLNLVMVNAPFTGLTELADFWQVQFALDPSNEAIRETLLGGKVSSDDQLLNLADIYLSTEENEQDAFLGAHLLKLFGVNPLVQNG